MKMKVLLLTLLFCAFLNVEVFSAPCEFQSRASETVQTFVSPGWPLYYPNNLKCSWNVTAREGFRILVRFLRFMTEECCDYLAVTDNEEEIFRIRGNLTNQESFVSPGQRLSFQFYTDDSVSHRGFYVTFQETQEPSRLNLLCGRSLMASITRQVITSLGWPRGYRNDLYCIWNITVRAGHKIRLDFSSFSTEYCCDYLAVLDGEVEILRIRGSVNITDPIISNSSNVRLIFFSDEDTTDRGFQANVTETREDFRYGASCGFNDYVTSIERSLNSPGYPGPYDNGLDCIWYLTAEYDAGVEVYLTFMDTESCCDHLYAYDGNEDTERVKMGFEPEFVSSFVSTQRRLTVRFVSDNSTSGRGFRMKYKEKELLQTSTSATAVTPPRTTGRYKEINECGFGAAAIQARRQLHSPGWPVSYGNQQVCQWTLVARPDYHVRIDFIFFSTEGCCDYLSVFQGRREILRLKGDISFPSPLISSSNRFFLRFRSDHDVTYRGFNAIYRATDESPTLPFAPCGFDADATGFDRNLSSPGWPRHYDPNLNCSWSVTARRGWRIRIDFLFLETESCCDTLSGYEDENEVFSFRGNGTGFTPYISTTNKLTLRFISDDSENRRGFRATFRETKEAATVFAPCGFVAVATSRFQTLNSPGWPDTYDNGLTCVWVISARSTHKILLRFLSFNTEACCDSLEIYDGESLRLRLSGDFPVIRNFSSRTSRIRLRFDSDYATTAPGFQVLYLEDKP